VQKDYELVSLPVVWYHTTMRKPRDYKAEHARRPLTQEVKALGVSFWRASNIHALLKLVPEGELKSVVDGHKISDAGLFQLLEIARADPEQARDLLKRPEEIGDVHKLEKYTISARRSRRVSAAVRIERAWPGLWDRWLQKFAPSDHQFVREECARRILEEIAEH
jgi:hypothetical protein